jgi:NAD(P) transhydrogenase subunit alpha|tara:strand:- start:819 stop:1109 length:291 start_codon:yes stop_codon:yes gene_type:complete
MRGLNSMEIYALLGFVLILSIYLGLELISKVPSTLHTPLMSGANAISGIAIVGALILSTDSSLQNAIAFLAVLFASINVFGGYLVTNRMLKMFKKK